MPQSQIRVLNNNSNCSNKKSYEIALITTNLNFKTSAQSQLQWLNHKSISSITIAQLQHHCNGYITSPMSQSQIYIPTKICSNYTIINLLKCKFNNVMHCCM